MLTSDEAIQIQKEVMLGLPPTLQTEEANAFREKVIVSLQQSLKEGKVLVDVPFDF